jgi:glycosyltransferase involved in cell wall biosynthesis
MKDNYADIAFSWDGLPYYAAKLIKASIDRLGEPCVVVASKPSVPIQGVECVLSQPVHWINSYKPISWSQLGLKVPNIFIQSGWSYPAFLSLGHEVKAAGGRVIGLSDANWRNDFRQLVLGPIAFRLLHRRNFDAMLVPGLQGQKLMQYFGMPQDRIFKGLYAADSSLFTAGSALHSRPKEFLFVGQFIERKFVIELAKAFIRFSEHHPEWRLILCGGGDLVGRIPRSTNISIEPFTQPKELVKRFNAARFLVLPSIQEAWGLVVHEATLCGCALILSDAIGSADDLASPNNGVFFKAGDEDDLLRALNDAAARDALWLQNAEAESRHVASKFSSQLFADSVASLVAEFRGTNELL